MQKVPDIQLTAHEQSLLEQIHFDWTGHDQLRSSLAPMAELTALLLDRNAIPEIRLRYFTDPDCNPGGRGKSRQDIFEKNGTSGDEILEHPNFLGYLDYFVFGPKLPIGVIQQFREMARFSGHLTVGDVNDLMPGARAAVRSAQLDPSHAADEMYKLALECGAMPSSAEIIRDTIRRVRI
jgi:hypothetical protein